jgi:hypothetical protein
MAEFSFKGGIRKPDTHTVEKFLLFFVIDGKEIPMFQLLRDGIILRKSEYGDDFFTGLKVAKLFLHQAGFNLRRRFHSLYFYFDDDPTAKIATILSFSELGSGFYFKGPIRFLKKAEVVDLLNKDELSLKFLERQEPLPVDTIKRLITVEQPHMKNIRHVRIGRGKKINDSGI